MNEYTLKPIPRLWLRVILFVVLMLPAFLSTAPWSTKILGLLLWAGLLGTFPLAQLRDGRFEKQFFVAFVPLKPRKWCLDKVARVEVNLAEPTGCWTAFVFGPANFFFFRLFDWLLPWIGGRYRLWLRSAKGHRVQVWQGSSDAAFEANVHALEKATGLSLERTGDYVA